MTLLRYLYPPFLSVTSVYSFPHTRRHSDLSLLRRSCRSQDPHPSFLTFQYSSLFPPRLPRSNLLVTFSTRTDFSTNLRSVSDRFSEVVVRYNLLRLDSIPRPLPLMPKLSTKSQSPSILYCISLSTKLVALLKTPLQVEYCTIKGRVSVPLNIFAKVRLLSSVSITRKIGCLKCLCNILREGNLISVWGRKGYTISKHTIFCCRYWRRKSQLPKKYQLLLLSHF